MFYTCRLSRLRHEDALDLSTEAWWRVPGQDYTFRVRIDANVWAVPAAEVWPSAPNSGGLGRVHLSDSSILRTIACLTP